MSNFLQNFIGSLKKKPLGGTSQSQNSFRPNSLVSPTPTPAQNVQNAPIMTANASATGTIKPVITPPKTGSALPPAGQQYAQSLAQPTGNGTITRFDPTKEATLPNDPSTGRVTTTTDNSPQSAYLKYLTGMFDPSSVDSARKSKEDSAKRLADIQTQSEKASYDARKGYEANLDRIGGTKEGAQQSSQVYARRSNDDLADLALQESAAARSAQVANDTYKEYIDAGKSVYEAEQAAAKAKSDADQQTFTNDLATKKYDEDVRQFGVSQANELQKARIAHSGSGGSGELSKLLSPAEAIKLGVPYGTTKGEAATLQGAGQTSGDQFYNLLNEYSKFLGDTSASGIALSPTKTAQKNNLKAQITALYKQKYALGTLDAGVQKLIDGLLGSGGIAGTSNKAQKAAIDSYMKSLPTPFSALSGQASTSGSGVTPSGISYTVIP